MRNRLGASFERGLFADFFSRFHQGQQKTPLRQIKNHDIIFRVFLKEVMHRPPNVGLLAVAQKVFW
jgi:hypothetical protein